MSQEMSQLPASGLLARFDPALSRRLFPLMRLPLPEEVAETTPAVIQEVIRAEIALNRSCRHVEIQALTCWDVQFRAVRAAMALMPGRGRHEQDEENL